MIELGKEYTTRDGKRVVILATNGRGAYPVVGQILQRDGEWDHNTWTANGNFYSDTSVRTDDLIEVKPVRVFERWVNIYANGTTPCHSMRQDADRNAGKDRIACLHIRQEYKEGEGL